MEVEGLLLNLGNLDSDMFYFQRDNIQSAWLVKNGDLDPLELERTFKHRFDQYDGMRAPFQGFDVGDVKNLSPDYLEKITNNFSQDNFILRLSHGRLFRGFIGDGAQKREVTVKTWDFVFLGLQDYESYPQKFRDEIVLLAMSELKAHPFLPKLIGFCFDKKLAVVYDLQFNQPLRFLLDSADFGWNNRMKVAIDYALLMKTLCDKQFNIYCLGSSYLMLDKEYNIKLVDSDIFAFPRPLAIYNSATVSDHTIIEKRAVYELGLLLLELVTGEERAWQDVGHPRYYISKLKKSFVVAERFEVDADTGKKITQLIESCVRPKYLERPDISSVFEELVSMFGHCPEVPGSSPWMVPLYGRRRPPLADTSHGEPLYHPALSAPYPLIDSPPLVD